MSNKGRGARATRSPRRGTEVRRKRIRADLVRRGVSADFSDAICDRLAPFSEDLTPELYDAVLSGVAMAFGVHRRGLDGALDTASNLAEVERLLGGFAGEMRKLDEALETLAAYLERIRRRTRDPEQGVLH